MSSLQDRIARLERARSGRLTEDLLQKIKRFREAIWESVPAPPGVQKITLEEHDAMMDEVRSGSAPTENDLIRMRGETDAADTEKATVQWSGSGMRKSAEQTLEEFLGTKTYNERKRKNATC